MRIHSASCSKVSPSVSFADSSLIRGSQGCCEPLKNHTIEGNPGRVFLVYGNVTCLPVMVTSISSRIFFSSRIMALRSAEI